MSSIRSEKKEKYRANRKAEECKRLECTQKEYDYWIMTIWYSMLFDVDASLYYIHNGPNSIRGLMKEVSWPFLITEYRKECEKRIGIDPFYCWEVKYSQCKPK